MVAFGGHLTTSGCLSLEAQPQLHFEPGWWGDPPPDSAGDPAFTGCCFLSLKSVPLTNPCLLLCPNPESLCFTVLLAEGGGACILAGGEVRQPTRLLGAVTSLAVAGPVGWPFGERP